MSEQGGEELIFQDEGAVREEEVEAEKGFESNGGVVSGEEA